MPARNFISSLFSRVVVWNTCLNQSIIVSRSSQGILFYLRGIDLYILIRDVLGVDFDAYVWPVSRLESLLGPEMVKTAVQNEHVYAFKICTGKTGYLKGVCAVSRQRKYTQFKINSTRSYDKYRQLIKDLVRRSEAPSCDPVTVPESEDAVIPRQERTWADDCYELLGFTPDELETADADSDD